jgi:hypothetical protein
MHQKVNLPVTFCCYPCLSFHPTCAIIEILRMGGNDSPAPYILGISYKEKRRMKCPYCNSLSTKVIDTRRDSQGYIRRRRECLDCDSRFSTVERPVVTNPLVVKRDGRREEFDRYKIISGIKIACARRPITARRWKESWIAWSTPSANRANGNPQPPHRRPGR